MCTRRATSALGLGLGLLLCVGIARYVRGGGGACLGARCRPRPSLHFSTPCARAASGEGARPEAPRRWELPPCCQGVAVVHLLCPCCCSAQMWRGPSSAEERRAAHASPTARRCRPLGVRPSPRACAPARANTLFSPTRSPARSAHPSAPDCPHLRI